MVSAFILRCLSSKYISQTLLHRSLMRNSSLHYTITLSRVASRVCVHINIRIMWLTRENKCRGTFCVFFIQLTRQQAVVSRRLTGDIFTLSSWFESICSGLTFLFSIAADEWSELLSSWLCVWGIRIGVLLRSGVGGQLMAAGHFTREPLSKPWWIPSPLFSECQRTGFSPFIIRDTSLPVSAAQWFHTDT